MKTTIPDDLKKDLPQNRWGKLLTVTPVVMTVVATLLAGLASSEMTKAQYDRAYAAQLQSKAGDQWGYFQAKKLRSAIQRNSLDLLQATTEVGTVDASKLGAGVSAEVASAMENGQLPSLPPVAPLQADLKAAIEAVEGQRAEAEIALAVAQVPDAAIADALVNARQNVMAFDRISKPVNEAVDRLVDGASRGDKALARDLAFGRIRYNAARYDQEARLNQAVANLLELQVRKSNLSAERHHRRSARFFFGMLGAQAAVIMSTFAMAAKQRSFLWSVAAAAGLAAVAFAIYVYLRV